jgi:hypothetical protein
MYVPTGFVNANLHPYFLYAVDVLLLMRNAAIACLCQPKMHPC